MQPRGLDDQRVSSSGGLTVHEPSTTRRSDGIALSIEDYMSEMDEVLKEFLVESYENMDRLDRDLVALEDRPEDRETLASIFRTIHTIKGTCGFLGFGKLEKVTHVGENLLARLRDGSLKVDGEITTALLSLVDAVRSMLTHLESHGDEGERDDSRLVQELVRLNDGTNKAKVAAGAAVMAPPKPAVAARAEVHADTPTAPLPLPTAVATAVAEPTPETAEVHAAAHAAAHAEVDVVGHGRDHGDDAHAHDHGHHGHDDGKAPAAAAAPTPAPKSQDKPAEKGSDESKVSDSNVRVDVGLLDKLMNLVGELVLARNQILQHGAVAEDAAFLATSQRLNLITTELQEGVMKTRMQPIGTIWGKFPRVVRDLALMCGKQVRVEMEGKNTELDRTIIEAIKDPLTHIVRNSVDHGIETAQERVAKGKPAEGRLLLRAYHEGGQVIIEIADDGGGIRLDKVKAKAIEKGLITAEHALRMSERETLHLIFLPGFSTAAKVTNVSGRGVGMDVVRTNIEKIGGAVDLSSRPGEGTTLRIKIPLTLAIIPALVVSCDGDRFAIPQVSLLELVRLESDVARTGIESIRGTPVYRLRGNLLPLVYLNRVLGLQPRDQDHVNIVVLQADGRPFGLVVDAINDTEEIVVKPLGKLLKGLPCYAGATIMGDGKVALILDVMGIAQAGRVGGEGRDRQSSSDKDSKATSGNKQTLLLVQVGESRRIAVPLDLVARLEEFSSKKVELASGLPVVQYREQILPLVDLPEMFAGTPSLGGEERMLQVIVYNSPQGGVGFVVDRILDIVEEDVTVKRKANTHGLLGSAVIQSKVTDLLDVTTLVSGLLTETEVQS
ncbi:MAG: chemotaxis protein CheW [Planctomycetota bacterium]